MSDTQKEVPNVEWIKEALRQNGEMICRSLALPERLLEEREELMKALFQARYQFQELR